MKTRSHRRTFLKQGTVLGGGLLLLGSKAQPGRAADTETKPVAGATSPANETIKTIRSLRTIHGNFLDKPLPESALKTILMDWWFKDWLGSAKPTEKETQMLQILKKCGFVELQKA